MPITQEEVQEILSDFEYLDNENANYRAYTQDLADFVVPRKAWINSIRSKGERIKFNFLYDTTATRALRIMAAGFHSNLTNPTSRWFAFETHNRDLMEIWAVRDWLRKCEDKIFSVFNGSNFYNVIQEFYTDFGAFGTGTFLMLEDSKEVVQFQEIPVQEVNRVLDTNGNLIGMYRKFRLRAMQAYRLWGENVGKSVLEGLKENKYQEYEFVHHVSERYSRDVSKSDAFNMKYRSLWIALKDQHVIQESGFYEMPYMSEVFYRDANDPNGFSPAMDNFATIKLVNAMKKTIIRAGMKQADPPLVMPRKGFILPLNFNPAAMNYRDDSTSNDDIQQLPVGKNMGINVDLIQLEQKNIEEGMFVPLFRALAEITKQMTIPEVQRRVAENMVLLGPVINRAIHGILDPTIERMFNILYRNGDIPTPPEEIQEQNFKPVYLSPLAKAQRASEIGDIQSFLSDVSAIASVLPSALDNVDEDETVNILSRVRGIPPRMLRDQEVVEKIRKQRAEQEQMMQALQAGQSIAGIAKDGSQAQQMSKQAGSGV